jgi:hypothetical protein
MVSSSINDDGDDGSTAAAMVRAQQLWPSTQKPSVTSAWEEAKTRELPSPAMRATTQLMKEQERKQRQQKTKAVVGRSVSDSEWTPFAAAKLKETFTRPVIKAAKESNIAAMLSEVRALQPTVVAATTTPSLRLEKLREKRLNNHDDAIKAFNEIRTQIDVELEQQVGERSKLLRDQLELSSARLQQLIMDMSDTRLVDMTEEDINTLRHAINQAYIERDHSITVLHNGLNDIETRRSQLVTTELERVIAQLTDIAHMQPDDIERLMHDDVRAVNVHVIRNRSAYDDLAGRLRIAEIQQREALIKQFDERRIAWRLLRHNRVIATFKTTMTTPEFQESPSRRALFDTLMATQRDFQQRVMTQIHTLLELTPPQIKPELVDKVTTELQAMYVTNDRACDALLHRLRDNEEATHQRALSLFAALKNELVPIAAFEPPAIDITLETECKPLVDARHTASLELLARVQRAVVREDGAFIKKIDSFSAFYKNAAKLWTDGMAQVDETINESTESIAQRHDRYQDDKAAHEKTLADLVELLAQEPTKEDLKARLDEIGKLVGPSGIMEETHRQANTESVALVLDAPLQLSIVTTANINAVAAFFGLRTVAEDQRLIALELKAKQDAEAAAAQAIIDAEEAKKASKATGKKGAVATTGSDTQRTPRADGETKTPAAAALAAQQPPKTGSLKKTQPLKPKELAALAEKQALEEKEKKDAEERRPRIRINTPEGEQVLDLVCTLCHFINKLITLCFCSELGLLFVNGHSIICGSNLENQSNY